MKFKFRKDYSGCGMTTNGIVKLSNAMNYAASNCVQDDFKSVILFKQDIFAIVNCLRKSFETRKFAQNPMWYQLWTEAKCGYTIIDLNSDEILEIVNAIEEFGTCKDDYQTMHELIRWYGIELVQMKVMKDFTPKDERTRWENVYDGPDQIMGDTWVDDMLQDENLMREVCNP